MPLKMTLYAALALLLLTGCPDQGTPTPSTSRNIIMPLGASRVEGARPFFESYRYELWKRLVDGGWDFDFIGGNNDLAILYPPYANRTFDVDHEGHGGFTSGEILDQIDAWLGAAGAPDIVLFSSPGGNDALQGLPLADAIDNVNAIIDALQAANPEVIIIIEEWAPARSSAMTPELTDFIQQMRAAVVNIAGEQTDGTSTVIPVDMYTDFTDAYLADEVHYNTAGAVFIAERYYTVLEMVMEP